MNSEVNAMMKACKENFHQKKRKKWRHEKNIFLVQWGSEHQTSPIFKWSILTVAGRSKTGHLKSGPDKTDYHSFQMAIFQSGIQMAI
jgi:hypothetical protein